MSNKVASFYGTRFVLLYPIKISNAVRSAITATAGLLVTL